MFASSASCTKLKFYYVFNTAGKRDHMINKRIIVIEYPRYGEEEI